MSEHDDKETGEQEEEQQPQGNIKENDLKKERQKTNRRGEKSTKKEANIEREEKVAEYSSRRNGKKDGHTRDVMSVKKSLNAKKEQAETKSEGKRRAKESLPENVNLNKKQKLTTSMKPHVSSPSTQPKKFTNYSATAEIEAESRSSSSGSAGGSVLSLGEAIESQPVDVDFDCRTVDYNTFCARKNKIIPYKTIFKKATKGRHDYDIRRDDVIGKQYRVIKMMGKGTFSHVFLCKDLVSKREIALKIFTQRNQPALVKIEQEIAIYLKKLDPNDNFNFVKMLDTFRCRNQFFIVYESLGLSLYDFMSKYRKRPYTMIEIQDISKQICVTLDFLHTQKIIHTDIKPENILFIDPIDNNKQLTSTRIKLIDFGSSILNLEDNRKNFGTVTTRHYRAPEVVMKIAEGWSYPIDVFSVGITIFEMHTQKLLFPSVISNLEHFVIMTYTLGELPSMYKKQKPHYFEHLRTLDENDVRKYKPLEKYFDLSDRNSVLLAKFIRRMVILDPQKRATMKELTSDPFLTTPIVTHS